MKARNYVKKHLPHTYVWSPCARTFVVKNGVWEVGDRARSKVRAWVNAAHRLRSAIRDKRNPIDGKTKAGGDQ